MFAFCSSNRDLLQLHACVRVAMLSVSVDWRTHMLEETSPSEESSEDIRPDIKTRWKKGQSGNPEGRKLKGSGCTLTGLARTLLERPVEGAEGRTTRLVAYLSDIVRLADDGDLKCRMFLLKEVGRGDRRKETAQRNAKRAKTEELRKFEEEKAAENSSPVAPLEPGVEDKHVVTVSPTAPVRTKPTAACKPAAASACKAPLPDDPSTFRRDPHTGRLFTPEGRALSQEEEERLLYPNWPHVSPHLKKEDRAGEAAGPASPAREKQASDSERNSGNEKVSREFEAAGAERKSTLH
jgi:hypothetical protein